MGANLITLAEYKAYAGLTSPTMDTTIESLIPKVSDLVKTICRRTFIDYVSIPKVEIFRGGRFLSLQEYPVIEIVSVEHSTDYGATYVSMTEFSDWVLDEEFSNIEPGTNYDVFPTLVNAYKVTYKAGFVNLPTDLKLAVFDIISYYLKNDAAVHNSRNPTGNTVQIQYIMSTSFPSNIQRVLDLYKANYS